MDYKHVQVKMRATKGMNVDKKVITDYTDLNSF